jgi:hypothetical protein
LRVTSRGLGDVYKRQKRSIKNTFDACQRFGLLSKGKRRRSKQQDTRQD